MINNKRLEVKMNISNRVLTLKDLRARSDCLLAPVSGGKTEDPNKPGNVHLKVAPTSCLKHTYIVEGFGL